MIDLLLISQIGIGIASPLAIWLSQDKRRTRQKDACLVGLFSQVFWMYFALDTMALGVIVSTIAHTYAWGKGVRNFWITRNQEPYLVSYNPDYSTCTLFCPKEDKAMFYNRVTFDDEEDK